VPHQAPWRWRVSLYTWTKPAAAGGFAVPVLLAGTGYLSWETMSPGGRPRCWRWRSSRSPARRWQPA
jgi:hypothetical protein